MGNLSHLDELEAEAIYIIREVAAECENPVMLYSIGNSSVMLLHLGDESIYLRSRHFRSYILITWKFKENDTVP